MNAERFAELAEAYGADPRRWPAAERAEAEAFAAAQGAAAERLLFDARQTDAALDASPVPEVPPALRAAILASAPKPRAGKAGALRWLWLPASGLAAACAAGIMVGALAATELSEAPQADTVIAVNAEAGSGDFGALDAETELL
jgi:hypothetical protein